MNKNNMICDITTGVCGEAGEDAFEMIDLNPPQQLIHLYYVTDPICSHCWALEPVLRKFEEQYGHYVKLHTVMGGLLESWDGFADVKNGINGPKDITGHWQEVGVHSRMPIDGSLWLNNPIQSSYPPSRVFKVIQQQDEALAKIFLRRAKEAVFAFNLKIDDEQVLIDLVDALGLDGKAIVKESGLSPAKQLLEQDFNLAKSLGVRGFPTIIMVNEENKGVKIVGARPLENYVSGLAQALGVKVDQLQGKPVPPLATLLDQEIRLFSKEIEVMYDIEQREVQSFIENELKLDGYIQKEICNEAYIEIKQK